MGGCLSSREEEEDEGAVEKRALDAIYTSDCWEISYSHDGQILASLPRYVLLCMIQQHDVVLDAFDVCFPQDLLTVTRDDFQVFISGMVHHVKRAKPPGKPLGGMPLALILQKTWIEGLSENFEKLAVHTAMAKMHGDRQENQNSNPMKKKLGGENELIRTMRDKEGKAMHELKAILKRDFAGRHLHGTPEPAPFMLLRYLRGYKNIPEEAAEGYIDGMNWREQQDMDSLCEGVCPDVRRAASLYPMGYHKLDHQGNPVGVEQLAGCDPGAILKEFGNEKFLKFYIQQIEATLRFRFPACSELAGRTVYQTMSVMDLKGVPVSLFFDSKARGLLTSIIGVLNHNYPEQMAGMFIINAPGAFSILWRVIRNFVDPVTRTKIRILGSNFLPELLKAMPIENVPEIFGGKCSCEGGCLNRQPGPWDTCGTPLPPHLDLGRILRGETDISVEGTPAEEEAEEPDADAEATEIQLLPTVKSRVLGALHVHHTRRQRSWKRAKATNQVGCVRASTLWDSMNST
eukprot:TRINITY_DN19062_c0_g1_i1.p1 TRINITY_DN19062_c0_g1~~TRINITY_DN19062_c0_g1_i1.p1  ORF type:complete len:517 (-),score=95.20 TRINITY_DN19062_c0_g1_i1:269-1819(-)